MDLALFAGGSVLVLLAKEEDEPDAAEAPAAVADQRPVRVALASCGVVFLQRLPSRLVRRFTAVVLALLAAATLVEAVRA